MRILYRIGFRSRIESMRSGINQSTDFQLTDSPAAKPPLEFGSSSKDLAFNGIQALNNMAYTTQYAANNALFSRFDSDKVLPNINNTAESAKEFQAI